MTRYVIDASVVIKSLLNEDKVVEGKFRNLLEEVDSGKAELISSKFLVIEVGNGLRFGVKDPEKCLSVFSDFLKLPIKNRTLSKIQVKQSVKTSYELDTTVYDTSYHVLAKSLNATFLTCDNDYFQKAKSLGDIELIS